MKNLNKNNRISLLAAYDKNRIIQDYVVNIIIKLSEISDVYCFYDNEIDKKELDKIKNYVVWAGSKSHGKYDFGSWGIMIDSIGWNKIENYDELILINDSVYGPMYDLKNFFKKMDEYKYEFYGITQSSQISKHLQSYFMVFRKSVFQDIEFRNFWKKISFFNDHRSYVEEHEIYLSKILIKNGHSLGSLVKYHRQYINPTCFPIQIMEKYKSPFIKVKCFKNPENDLWENYKDLIIKIQNNNYYDYKLIENHINRKYISNIIMKSYRYEDRIFFRFLSFYFTVSKKNKLKFIYKNKKLFSLYIGETLHKFMLRKDFFKFKINPADKR